MNVVKLQKDNNYLSFSAFCGSMHASKYEIPWTMSSTQSLSLTVILTHFPTTIAANKNSTNTIKYSF